MISVLLLAVYRYVACFQPNLYKRINSRLLYIYGLIVGSWVISFLLPLVWKFSLGTTYSIYFCTDGFNPDSLAYSIIYYVINLMLSSAIPFVVIVVLYVKIYKRLEQQSRKALLNSVNSNKLAKFAKHFIILNILLFISTLLATFLDLANVIAVRLFCLFHSTSPTLKCSLTLGLSRFELYKNATRRFSAQRTLYQAARPVALSARLDLLHCLELECVQEMDFEKELEGQCCLESQH